MKIEILCPSCGRGYLMDETNLPSADGEIPCLNCGSMIEVKAGAPPPAPASISVPAEDRSPPAVAEDRTGAIASPTATEPAAALTAVADQIVCPRCGLHFQPRGSHAAARPAERRPTVLVVEDMEYFQEIARDALQEKFEVKSASDIESARRAVLSGGIDLLVIDLTLDEQQDGVRFIASLQPKPCPIVIFTAEDEADLYGDKWDELQAMGADDLVLKGMNVGEALVRKVCGLLGIAIDDDDIAS